MRESLFIRKVNRKTPWALACILPKVHGVFLQGHKKHPEKASHLCPMQAELGIGDGRP